MELDRGTRVLVTAGAAGIGRAMAEAFDAARAAVWVTDVDPEALARCPSTWERTEADVTDEPAIASLFADIDDRWKGIDVVCANAGIAGPTAPIEDVALDDWRRCVAVNLDGAFLVTKHAAPLLKRQRSGVLLLTSSTVGFFGYPHRAPYAASKWAVLGLMKTLAMELGPFGVRANAICPGAVEGPRMESVMEREAAARGTTRDEVHRGYAAGTSMRTWVETRDIAAMAVFLASPAARYVSGQVIAVDGHTFNPDPQVGT